MDRKGQGNFRGKNHHVAGLTEPGNPRHPQRPPTGMIKGHLSNRLSNLGMKPEEIARVAVE